LLTIIVTTLIVMLRDVSSQHDSTVSALLSAMEVFNDIAPSYTSTVFIELFNTSKGQLSVKVWYKNNTFSEELFQLVIPGLYSVVVLLHLLDFCETRYLNKCMLNHCLQWYKWVLTNFDHNRQWFHTLIPPLHESAAVSVTVDCISHLSEPVRLTQCYTTADIHCRDKRYEWDGGITSESSFY